MLRPSAADVQRAIMQRARRMERLSQRRKRLLYTLASIEDQIKLTRRELSAILTDSISRADPDRGNSGAPGENP